MSKAYPLLSIADILVYLGAVFWPQLGEDMNMQKNIGILIIIIGVVIVSLPGSRGGTVTDSNK